MPRLALPAGRSRPSGQPRGFNMLEAMLAGVVLAGGTVAVVQGTRILLAQLSAVDREEGHALVVERLVVQEVNAILTRTPLNTGAPFPVMPPIVEPSGLAYEVRLSRPAQANCLPAAIPPLISDTCDPVDVWVVLRSPDASGVYPATCRLYQVGQGGYVTPRVRVWPRKGYPWQLPLI